MSNYYKRCINHYSQRSAPLRNLVSMNAPFKWDGARDLQDSTNIRQEECCAAQKAKCVKCPEDISRFPIFFCTDELASCRDGVSGKFECEFRCTPCGTQAAKVRGMFDWYTSVAPPMPTVGLVVRVLGTWTLEQVMPVWARKMLEQNDYRQWKVITKCYELIHTLQWGITHRKPLQYYYVLKLHVMCVSVHSPLMSVSTACM